MDTQYTVTMKEATRKIIANAMSEYVQSHIGRSEIPYQDWAEAMQLLTVLDAPDLLKNRTEQDPL